MVNEVWKHYTYVDMGHLKMPKYPFPNYLNIYINITLKYVEYYSEL